MPAGKPQLRAQGPPKLSIVGTHGAISAGEMAAGARRLRGVVGVGRRSETEAGRGERRGQHCAGQAVAQESDEREALGLVGVC